MTSLGDVGEELWKMPRTFLIVRDAARPLRRAGL